MPNTNDIPPTGTAGDVSDSRQRIEPNHTSAPITGLLGGSKSAQIALLFLYSLPLFLFAMSALVSLGFTRPSSLLEFTLRISNEYFGTLRTAFATFVIPFVTAAAAAGESSKTHRGLPSLTLFFILVGILVMALVLVAYIGAQDANFVTTLNIDETEANKLTSSVPDLLEAYVKEVLTYISLLAGVSIVRGVANE